MQVPVIGNPVAFLGTWVHEMGHGLGAIMTGGQFLEMVVSPDFSGMAYTSFSGNGSRMILIITGLLAPSFVGALLLILARGLGQGRLALGLLVFGLFVCGLFWAGDMFTRITVLGAGLILGLIAVKTPQAFRVIFAQIVAVSICLNAVNQIDYYFMRGGVSGGREVVSDTEVLTQIFGLPHVVWALLLTGTALLMLFLAVRMSAALYKKRALKTLEQPL